MLPGLAEVMDSICRRGVSGRKYQIVERPLVPPKSIGELAIELAQDDIAHAADYYGVQLSTMAKWTRMELDELRRQMWHKERT